MHLLVRLPVAMETVWPAVSTPDGIASWWTGVDRLEPRLGGAVVLRGPVKGRVTAWDVDRVAEYTLEGAGRIRFHLERDGDDAAVLRFTGAFPGEEGREPEWRARLEHLGATLRRA
ncbi:hypothetical protein U5640_18790 [Streptomyces sp. SS7]|uniref:hypothetical protein n=1 Tax=Streptomyces sp. SS7 TaxID=3108485 RepID=UPI0030EB51BC